MALSQILAGTGLAEKLGILEVVRNKLLNNPNKAAEKLGIVVIEVSKIYYAVDGELMDFSSLLIGPELSEKDIQNARRTLEGMQGVAPRMRMMDARGHCEKIKTIRKIYLEGWLNNILNKEEQAQIANLFESLDAGDKDMVVTIDKVGEWLRERADKVVALIDAKDWDGANALISAARPEIDAAQDAAEAVLKRLESLKQDFFKIARAV